jgi:formate dehydrogenase accessory protein FdhE
MAETWGSRVARARRLRDETAAADDLLRFYVRLLEVQEQSASRLESCPLTGAIERDMPRLLDGAPAIMRAVQDEGSTVLVREARQLMGDASALEQSLAACWASPSDDQFFAKALLQPYAATLALRGITPAGRPTGRAGNRCPICGGPPQLSILEPPDARGEGGGRKLLCATCLTPWPVPRMNCAQCGEDREAELGYFQSPDFDHVLVEVCDACRCYEKRIDRSRLGIAVPIVDEVAAAVLDLWATGQGYRKIELNLIGL